MWYSPWELRIIAVFHPHLDTDLLKHLESGGQPILLDSPDPMNHFAIRIEQILILLLSIALLLSYWKITRAKIRELRQLFNDYHPRKWKPQSPDDCPSRKSGIYLAILKPNADVIPYSQRKSTRGRKKNISCGHTLTPRCMWFPPSVVKGARKRYRQSRARTDESDGKLIANLLRTDLHPLYPWRPDSLLTRQMRARISLHLHLTRACVRLNNRLRAVLLRYYPTALQVFSKLSAPVTLNFILVYPTPPGGCLPELHGLRNLCSPAQISPASTASSSVR